MKKIVYSHLMKRWLSVVVLVLASVTTWAGGTGSTYYYSATARISPTGSGKVYVATTASDNPAYQTTNQTITGSQYSASQARVTFYYYAQANDGYIFKNWIDGSNNVVSTNRNWNITETVTSTNQNSRTAFSYTAVFEQQTGMVKVASSDNSRGVINISNPNNVNGETVTLYAYPDVSNGVTFVGWRKGNDTSLPILSTDLEYTLEANSSTTGTYYAFFTEPEEQVYIRLQNKKTGRFLSIYGNTKPTNHQGTQSGQTFQDGFIFTNSLKMVDASTAQGNPSTVFLRSGHPSGVGVTTGANLSELGVTLASNTSNGLIANNYTLQFNRNADGETFRIYTTMSVDDNGTPIYFSSYLCDEGTDWLVMKGALTGAITDESDTWYVYVLGENTTAGAFGANTKAKFTKDGKYYTTMYAPFAYQLLDGVKAYYLPADIQHYNEDTHTASFQEVTSGIIHENTAVILECPAVQNEAGVKTDVVNRLLPLTGSTAETVPHDGNLLKGYAPLNGQTVTNDKTSMYVLSYSNRLGFFRSSSNTMSAFKAYLDLSQLGEQANEVAQRSTFQFGAAEDDTTPTEIRVTKTVVNEDEDAPYYDLQGRRLDRKPQRNATTT